MLAQSFLVPSVVSSALILVQIVLWRQIVGKVLERCNCVAQP